MGMLRKQFCKSALLPLTHLHPSVYEHVGVPWRQHVCIVYVVEPKPVVMSADAPDMEDAYAVHTSPAQMGNASVAEAAGLGAV
jgi:hypothetical protein